MVSSRIRDERRRQRIELNEMLRDLGHPDYQDIDFEVMEDKRSGGHLAGSLMDHLAELDVDSMGIASQRNAVRSLVREEITSIRREAHDVSESTTDLRMMLDQLAPDDPRRPALKIMADKTKSLSETSWHRDRLDLIEVLSENPHYIAYLTADSWMMMAPLDSDGVITKTLGDPREQQQKAQERAPLAMTVREADEVGVQTLAPSESAIHAFTEKMKSASDQGVDHDNEYEERGR